MKPMNTQPPPESTDESRILSSSAVMAAGTVVSRLSGFVRSALLVAAGLFDFQRKNL